MTRRQVLAGAVVAVLGLGAGMQAAGADSGGGKLEFEDFVGVGPTQLRDAGAIRGVLGGGLPWGIGEAEVEVRSSGRVEVEFQDLVFLSGPNVGRNTVPSMAVVVTCLDGTGAPVRATSAPFPVTVPGGDAEAETTIALPPTCVDPIALITNAAGTAWFAASAADD